MDKLILTNRQLILISFIFLF